MRMLFTRKINFVFTLFLLPTLAFAKSTDEKIPCPSIEIIKLAALNIDRAYGGKYDNSYSTSASIPYYEKDRQLSWYVGAWVESAPNNREAILAGQGVAQAVQFSKHPYAEVFTDHYGTRQLSCDYGPGEVSAGAREFLKS